MCGGRLQASARAPGMRSCLHVATRRRFSRQRWQDKVPGGSPWLLCQEVCASTQAPGKAPCRGHTVRSVLVHNAVAAAGGITVDLASRATLSPTRHGAGDIADGLMRGEIGLNAPEQPGWFEARYTFQVQEEGSTGMCVCAARSKPFQLFQQSSTGKLSEDVTA